MTYLVFTTEDAANTANDTIGTNMGLPRVGHCAKCGEEYPTHQQTEVWATPRQRLDGKWVIPSCPDCLESVTDYTEEEYSDAWFPALEEL